MAREFKGPLSASDLEYLRARHTEAYVERQVELLGVKDNADSEEAQAKAEAKVQKAAEQAEREAQEAAAKDAAEAEQAALAARVAATEDLIGDTGYDPGEHTVEEINKHLKTVSEEERESILAREREGRGRTSIDGI